jgi:hypothetical protein
MSIVLVGLNVIPGGRSQGQSGHFGWSRATITPSSENSIKTVFGRTLEAHMSMKGCFARVGPTRDLLSDLRALQNPGHFGSTMLRDKYAKHRVFAN